MINIAGYVEESIVDGEGIRFALFTQGCNHNCLGCHNPETHPFCGGSTISDDIVLQAIKENPLIDGLTLSGGDPLFQASNLLNLARKCNLEGINIWLYTGFVFDEFIKFIKGEQCDKRINADMIELLHLVDIVVDGPFILSQRSLQERFKGSLNQRIIDCKKSLKDLKITLYELE